MSQKACCVPGCSFTVGCGTPLHHFPNPKKKYELFMAWVTKIGGHIKKLDDDYIFKNRKVCQRHFDQVYIYPKKLCGLAVPSLCLPDLPDSTASTSLTCESATDMGQSSGTDICQSSGTDICQSSGTDICQSSGTDICQSSQTDICQSSRTNMCRLCATVTEFVVPIFEGEGLQNSLADKIHQHLPIQVSENDVLPVVMCFQCTSTLLAWHELVVCSVQADNAMRERFNLRYSSQQQQQQQTSIAPGLSEAKDDKSQVLRIIINVLKEYLFSVNMEEDGPQMVCQKCTTKPSLTMEHFAEHLHTCHHSDVSSEEAILNFIKDNVTFEEALMSDFEREADSDSTGQPEIQKQKPVPTLLCPYCSSAFSSTSRLIHHLNKHVEIPMDAALECCGALYSTKSDFVKHLQEKHVNRLVYDMETMCKTCGFPAASGAALQAHVKESHAEHKTDKKKKTLSTLNQKAIPAVCPECNKTFSNKYNMFFHMKSHKTSAIHRCDKCGRGYSTRGNLTQHVRVAHEGQMRCVCPQCGETFPTRGARDTHARLHSGARPFRCELCGRRFRAGDSLARHRDMHLDVRRHACRLCRQAFRKRSHLAAHARTHRP